MPRMRTTLKVRKGNQLATIDQRINAFKAAELRARVDAAKEATHVTQNAFKYKRQGPVVPRPRRASPGGKFHSYMLWQTNRNGGIVQLNVKKLDAEAPYWIIQEIGTGKRATLKQAGKPNPRGRPSKGSTYVKTVKSQRGRRIKGGLVFADGGRYSPPGASRNQQLYAASTVSGAPNRLPRMIIKKEIIGQHFVQQGGRAGFRTYRTSVLAAARRTLGRRGFTP